MDMYTNAANTLRNKGDNNFCVPLAISVVSGMDIEAVNEIMFTTPSVLGRLGRKHGMVRRKGQGVYEADWANPELLKKFGITFQQIPVSSRTVKTLPRELVSNRRYVVKVRRHALAYRHGEIQDWTKGRQHRVQTVYMVCDLDGNPLTDGDNVPAPAPVHVPATPRPAPAAPRRAPAGNLLADLEREFWNATVKQSGRWVSIKFHGELAIKVTQSKGRTVMAISHADTGRMRGAMANPRLRLLSERAREITFAGTLDEVTGFITALQF